MRDLGQRFVTGGWEWAAFGSWRMPASLRVPASLPRPQCGAFLNPFSLWEDPGHCESPWLHTSVPGGEEQCLPHLRIPAEGPGKAAVPGLEGSQNTDVNYPDHGKKEAQDL